jgi:ribosomal protein L37E
MRVLVGCESSGVVRDAFAARGHDAWSCDLLPSDSPGQHLQCDVFTILREGWDLFIAHPMCKYLSVSGMHWTKRGLRDPQLTVDAITFAERLWETPIPRVAIENPVGVLSTRSRLGKPTQIIQPYRFGHDASKGTCLWLKGLPPLKHTEYVKPRLVCKACGEHNTFDAAFGKGCAHCGVEAAMLMPRWANQTDSGQNRLGPSERRWRERSRTYKGIAAAMAEQWGDPDALAKRNNPTEWFHHGTRHCT